MALYLLWSQRKVFGPLSQSASFFPLLWCGLIFLLFSIAKNKQEYYIAPIYPLMAVVFAGVFERTADISGTTTEAARLWKWGFLLISVAILALSVGLLVLLPSFLPSGQPVMHYGPSLLIFAGFVVLVWKATRGKFMASLYALLVSLFSIFLITPAAYLPAIESQRPVKSLCVSIDAIAGPDDGVGYFGASLPSMAFYLRRPIFEEFDADSMTRRFLGNQRVFCILTREDYSYFVKRRNLLLYIIDRRPRLMMQLGRLIQKEGRVEQELVLASNRPPGEQD
jgi:hypothetical protein